MGVIERYKSKQKNTTKNTEKRTYFKKGAFEDGYQFGDIFKTVSSSASDIGENISAGILGMGEKAVDAGAYIAGGIGGLFGADGFKEDTKEFIAKDLYDEKALAKKLNLTEGLVSNGVKAILGFDSEKNSVFGEKTDALAQSAGQLGATAALQAVGVPWYLTTGVTSFGGAAEEAFRGGATYGEAGASAAITAGAEILFEKLSGGIKFGGKTLDDVLLTPLTQKISNKTLRTLVNFGFDVAGEGTEEVLSSVFSNLGTALYKEESIDELLFSEEAMDEYLESYIGGAVLGGGSSGSKAVNSAIKGRDYKTGLTENEQKIVDKEVESRIAEAEKDGAKLSAKQKEDVRLRVTEELKKGYISTDTIESVLGTDGIQKKLAKDDYLRESYNEKARRGQAFKADLSKYDAKQSEVVKKAAESGILNNTNRTHEFVDMIAKISADKGVSFDFTNNERLKSSGFAVDGKTVNGYVTKDGITLNIQSAKALNSVVGHEITHVLEGTEHYSALQNAAIEYAKAKGEYESRYENLKSLYANVEGADIGAELTADLVGDYLFTDIEFINTLSAKHRNVFQKIYDEIKYLCKIATAGSKEARELEKVKKAFDKAYRESGKVKESTEDSGVKYSLCEFYDGQRFVSVETDQKLFDGLSIKEQTDLATKIIKSRFQGKVIGIDNKAFVNGNTVDEFTHPAKHLDSDIYEAKMRASTELDNLMDAGFGFRNEPDGKYGHTHSDAVGGFDYFEVIFKVGSEYYQGLINIKNIARGKLLKDITKIKNITQDMTSRYGNNPSYAFLRDASMYSISQNSEKSTGNEKNSLSASNDDIGPVGNYKVYGKDIALDTQDIGPVREMTDESGNNTPAQKKASETKNTPPAGEDIGPVKDTGNNFANKTVDSFGIKKLGDYIHVQKQVFDTLLNEGFFTDSERRSRTDVNEETGMIIETNKSSISETFNQSNYGRLGKARKLAKLSTVRMIPEIIKKGVVIADNVPNQYGNSSNKSFAYITYKTVVNGTSVTVKLDIKKSPQKNKLWVHSIIINENSTGLDVYPENEKGTSYRTDANENIISQDLGPVKPLAETFEDIGPVKDPKKVIEDIGPVKESEEKTQRRSPRADLHANIVNNIRSKFSEKGYDFDKVLKEAKDLSTFSTVDNTPQRVMEKALGYKEGGILADLTVNRVAQNETQGIKWLNSYTSRKGGVLAELSKKYNIKPGSKESAAAQMYAEGFYVDENNQIIKYGDAELARDFPNAEVQSNIKGLAKDPQIREIYDTTLKMINESRVRNAYPEIQRLDNYFLHFRAMDDTFSKLGIPFNPKDIRAKDLPTDLNGVTADLKPGQPYFASAKHRTGKRTSFDLLGGLERYLSSAKNQIYHIDDIQTLRALRNYIADTYGQANGLEGLDELSEEEAQDKIQQVYKSHLSTFAKFLNEEANIIAGKTALIDRGLEGIIGRRGITFLDTVNKQVGSNMVGFNISSSLTNFIPVVQTFAKTNKADFVKAFGQTVSHKVGSLFGNKGDGFAESSPVMIRRKGAERYYRTPWQKAGDAGYVLMGAVDNASTELIARTKYNELTRKGMDPQQAHFETDKWVSRLMGDRSIGQTPQLYNSKMLGIVTKFQLEVRNQLDSQFYDTIQEAKASTEDIQDGLARNAKTAAKVAAVFFELAVAQHLFGKAFEAVAGYNPAFDIIEVIIKTFGFDDDEDDEDTALDNIEEGFLTLLEDLPYTSAFMGGGRIPISSALPVSDLINGEDEYGNEKNRMEIIKETAPYYLLPSGYGQAKKSVQGLSMFDDDLPIKGSYTDRGDLRFPVEDTPMNRVQAGLFGQWANANAKTYLESGTAPIKSEKIPMVKAVGGYDAYNTYVNVLKDIESDKDKDGKAISGSRKRKVIDYINGIDADYGEKIILYKSQYKSDNTYNYDIVEYLNSREDLSYDDVATILTELGFDVLADGTVRW